MALLFTACGHKPVQSSVPAPPAIALPTTPTPEETASAEDDDNKEALHIPADAKPLAVETGTASWYGAPYHNRRGSNGEIYNMHAFTAAHLTLPLGSIVRVTNVKTGHTAVVRITDRGPFVEGRIIDLSLAAAKQVDVYQPGTATVKLEILQTPASLDQGGRWAVQVGALDKQTATDLADHLTRRYHSAKVSSFCSPVGDWWVRVRVQNDTRERAQEVARNTSTSEGSIFLVRLD